MCTDHRSTDFKKCFQRQRGLSPNGILNDIVKVDARCRQWATQAGFALSLQAAGTHRRTWGVDDTWARQRKVVLTVFSLRPPIVKRRFYVRWVLNPFSRSAVTFWRYIPWKECGIVSCTYFRVVNLLGPKYVRTRFRPSRSASARAPHRDHGLEGKRWNSVLHLKNVLEGDRVHVSFPSESVAGKCRKQPSQFVAAYDDDVRCLLYTSPSPRDQRGSRMPSSA